MLNHKILVTGKSYFPVPKYICNIQVYQVETEPIYWFTLEVSMSELDGMTLEEKEAFINTKCEEYYQTEEVQAIVTAIEQDIVSPLL